MSEFEVEVFGAPPPRKPDGPLTVLLQWVGKVAGATLRRPRLIVAGALAAVVLFVGTPHAGWDYGCRHPIRHGQPCKSVSYCAYYGFQGRQVVFPRREESCKLITLLPINWRQVM